MRCRSRYPRVLLLASWLAACAGATPLEVRTDTDVGLVQIVRVSNVEPKQGETIDFLSTVRNPTSSPISAEILEDCLGFDGDLRMENTNNFSFGCWSVPGPLLPGDSMVEGVSMIIKSPPGVYSVRVQHIVDPDVAVAVKITVK